MKSKLAVPIIAIICITGLEIFAMRQGLDGYLFSIAVAGIAGIAGFKLNGFLKRIRERK